MKTFFLAFALSIGLCASCSKQTTTAAGDAPADTSSLPDTVSAQAEEQQRETPSSPSPWTQHPCALRGANCTIPMQFPQDYTPLRPYPMLFFYPGCAPKETRSRIALLADATPTPAVAAGWPQYTAAEAILEHASNNLNTLPTRRFLVIPLTREGLLFACRHASFFNGLIIRCFTNTSLSISQAEAALLANLARLPVFIDSSAIPEPPEIVRPLTRLLTQFGATHLAAPEFLFTESVDETQILQRALDFLCNSIQGQPERSFKWRARELKYSQAFWLKMTAFHLHGRTAMAEGEIKNDGINGSAIRLSVTTTNLDGIAVRRDFPGLRKEAPLAITIDNQPLILPKPAENSQQPQWSYFQRDEATGKWRTIKGEAELAGRKNALCEGPVGNLLRQPFAIVTAGLDETQAKAWTDAANAFAEKFGQLYGYTPPVVKDQDFLPEKFQGMPLLLFGGPEDNALSAALLENDASFLPQLYRHLAADLREAEALGCATLHQGGFVAPGQMVLMVIGNSPKTLQTILRPFEKPEAFDECDFLFFDAAKGQKLLQGFLDSTWNP